MQIRIWIPNLGQSLSLNTQGKLAANKILFKMDFFPSHISISILFLQIILQLMDWQLEKHPRDMEVVPIETALNLSLLFVTKSPVQAWLLNEKDVTWITEGYIVV